MPAGHLPFDRQGMWIWYIDKSEGGSLPRIIAKRQALRHRHALRQVRRRRQPRSQFTSSPGRNAPPGGLDVCAWQFVYGDSPVAEAKVGAASVARGADCLVIDAEGEYEGKYAAAERYIRALRARIGPEFPLSLAGFPYVDYHPAFPYSVFFGPGGATYNQPQMYWKAIGTSVRAVYEHTYLFNRLWGHPIYPLGQTYGGAGRKSIQRFRRFAASYENLAPSWWDWQETKTAGWQGWARKSPNRSSATARSPRSRCSRAAAGATSSSGPRSTCAPPASRSRSPASTARSPAPRSATSRPTNGLKADGAIGTATWQSLLRFEPTRYLWAGRRVPRDRAGATLSRAIAPSRPLSASLPAKGYEIIPAPGPNPYRWRPGGPGPPSGA